MPDEKGQLKNVLLTTEELEQLKKAKDDKLKKLIDETEHNGQQAPARALPSDRQNAGI